MARWKERKNRLRSRRLRLRSTAGREGDADAELELAIVRTSACSGLDIQTSNVQTLAILRPSSYKALFGFPTCQLLVGVCTFTSTANTMAVRAAPRPPWDRLRQVLQDVQRRANVFPHLESVVGRLVDCLDVVQVSHSRFFRLLRSELGHRKPQTIKKAIKCPLNSRVRQTIWNNSSPISLLRIVAAVLYASWSESRCPFNHLALITLTD